MEHGIRIKTVILLLILLSGATSMYAQSCLPDGITFTTQSQVDSFQILYPNCTEIEGDLLIPYPNSISNLYGLNSIITIGGELMIIDCEELVSLDGLNSLESIGGALSLVGNDNLLDLSALQNLRSIGGGLTISWNDRLKSLSGIDSIDAETIDALHMIYNDSLSWCAVESICQYLGSPNPSATIQNAAGCESIQAVEESCQQGISQEWAPIGAMWHYTERTVNPDIISYNTFKSIANDTINGIPCKRIVEVDRYWGDSIVKTHYMYSENDSVFFFKNDEFQLLYDFGAVEGDTIVLSYFGTASGDSLLMIVDSTSTIDINGETRTIQYVTCGDGIVVEFGEEIIEGIGSTYYMFPVYDGQPYSSLRCYEDNIVGLFLSPYHPNHWWNFEDCEEIITGIDEITVNQSLKAYPNPFTTFTTIEYEVFTGSNIQYTVYNSVGEAVVEGEDRNVAPGNHTITPSLQHLPAGLYFVVLSSGEGVSVMKLIKQ